MPIHNRQDFHALPALGEAYSLAAALGRRKRGIAEALAFVDRPFVAQGIGQLRKDVPQHLPLTPLLEAAMDGFVVGITRRQQVPLCAGVQNPEHGFQNGSRGDGFAAGARVREMFFGEVFPNPVPLVIAQAEHNRTYRDGDSSRQLF